MKLTKECPYEGMSEMQEVSSAGDPLNWKITLQRGCWKAEARVTDMMIRCAKDEKFRRGILFFELNELFNAIVSKLEDKEEYLE